MNGQERLGIALIDTAHQAAAPLAHPAVGRQPAVRRRHPADLRRCDRTGRLVLRGHQRVRWRPPADQRHRGRLLLRPAATTSSPSGSRAPSTASTRWRSPRRPSTSVATSPGTSRPRLRTRGPAQDDIGYGTGQGLSAYGLGDGVVTREHLGALNPADGKALEWDPGSNSYEGNKAMVRHPAWPDHRWRRHHPGRRQRRPPRVLRLRQRPGAERCRDRHHRADHGSSAPRRVTSSRSRAPRRRPTGVRPGRASRSRTGRPASTSRTT